VTSIFVPSGGLRIHVKDFGGSGPPLLMLHSTGFGQWMWKPMAAALSARFHLYAPEQRGHGDSDKTEEGFGFPYYAADMLAVVDGLGVDRFYALGHSGGASTWLTFDILHPGRIERLLAIEPVLMPPGMRRGGEEGGVPARLSGARRRRANFESPGEMFERFRDREPFSTWREEALRLYCWEGTRPREGGGVTLKCPPDQEARFYETVGDFPLMERLADVRAPVRIVWGEGTDRPIPEGLPLPVYSQRVVVGASHFLPMEMPELVVEEALSFLAGGEA
jgi:pimeloyl-ACP methyl ester carboxylesterase